MERGGRSFPASSHSSMHSSQRRSPANRSSHPIPPNLMGPCSSVGSGLSNHVDHMSGRSSVSRILSRNVNGTIAMTSQPSNESELQLYRVLQRANLLAYYDTFICQGGDDVQQLCEAGEEEFLEIMALVGMASKPLHVRRLQKSLQEWVSNPVAFLATAMFQGPPPVFPPPPPGPQSSGSLPPGMTPAAAAALMSAAGGGGGDGPRHMPPHSAHHPRHSPSSNVPLSLPNPPPQSHSSRDPLPGCPSQRRSPVNLMGQAFPGNTPPSSRRVTSPVTVGNLSSTSAGTMSSHSSPSPTHGKEQRNCISGGGGGGCSSDISSIVLSIAQHQAQGNFTCNMREGLITNEYGQPASPVSLTPVLLDSQIQRLSDAAETLIKSLPPLDPKLATNKKRISKELEHVMNMSEDDSRRLDEIRKYAAIYGRFDCKRKPEKPLTLHEVSVNEAAAQICKHIPALLTRRDELFPLARQVVRDSGYQYSKGHSRSQMGIKRPFDESGNAGNSNCSNSKYFNSSGSNDAKDTDDTEDSQYSLYSTSDSGGSPGGDQGSSNSQDGHEDRRNGTRVTDGTDDAPSPHHAPHEAIGSSGPLCTESSGNPENFSKLLPAKKSGNFGSASQLAKQLVQETLLDEGMKVVKEFNSDPQTSPNGMAMSSDSVMSLTTSASTPTTASSSTESSPIKSDPITSIMGRHQSPQMMHHYMTQQHGAAPSRARGRPPKSLMMADRLEAAYHEKLTQHIQQSFLASQAYNQALAAANGFPNRSMMPGNGHGSGLEQIMSQGNETHENLNGRGNGQFTGYENTDRNSSPKDLVMRSKNKSNGSELDLIADLSVKQEQQQSNGNGCSIMDSSD